MGVGEEGCAVRLVVCVSVDRPLDRSILARSHSYDLTHPKQPKKRQGTVIIVANEGSVIMIPDGTVLEDKVVTGNLRILDH